MKTEGAGIARDMEFLVKELHKEWDRTGAVEASVPIPPEQAGAVNGKIKEHIRKRQKLLEGADMTFQQSMCRAKECYILFRLAKKIQRQEARVDIRCKDDGFSIQLDQEEYQLFRRMFPGHPTE